MALRATAATGGGDEPSPADAKLLFDVKLVLIFAVGVATMLASLTPWWIAARLGGRRSLDAICCASALSAGVVAGALLTHMLPEAAESFAGYFEARAGGEVAPGDRLAAYPFAGLLCGAVFLVLTAVDVLIVRRGADGAGHSHGADGGGHDHISEGLSLLKARVQQPPPPASQPAAAGSLEMEPLAAARALRLAGDGAGGEHGGAAAHHHHHHHHHHGDSGAKAGGGGGGGYGAVGHGGEGGNGDDLAGADAAGGGARRRMARAYVFFAALSLHGVFDGLSVGSEDAAATFTSTAFAVLSHKLFDGLALGCALYPLGLRALQLWLLLGACALTTPAGIAAGVVASSAADSTTLKLVNGVFLASASGSFMFISLTELWPSSVADGRLVPVKLAMFAGGFGAMAVLAAYV